MKEKEERFVVDGSSVSTWGVHTFLCGVSLWGVVKRRAGGVGGVIRPPLSKKMCGLNSERMQRCDLVEVVHGGDGVEGDDRAVTDR